MTKAKKKTKKGSNGGSCCYLTFLWQQLTKLFQLPISKPEPVPLINVLHNFCHRPVEGDKKSAVTRLTQFLPYRRDLLNTVL